MPGIDGQIAISADPETASLRLESLLRDVEFAALFEALPDKKQNILVNIISQSRLFFRYISRHPTMLTEFGAAPEFLAKDKCHFNNFDELKYYKYMQLLNITCIDLSGPSAYSEVLKYLSLLADSVVNQAFLLSVDEKIREFLNDHLAAFALGKLGAEELNFSSDIDLVFVCDNSADSGMDIYAYQKLLQDSIRQFGRNLEQPDANGFLYRVDLKLRPWGKSGPLVMTIDETENYYEASSEAWERFAWLRGRSILGSEVLSKELLSRLKPFIYRRSLSSDDLDRFVEIKNEMTRVRRKKGSWNVKVGEGGIRDLEFFIQMLQMVNAYSYPDLQMTGTLNVLNGLHRNGLVSEKERAEISHSYLFLRRLENHLQMVDEQQTHDLPDDWKKRLIIARSIGLKGGSDSEILDQFETELFTNISISRNYFDRLLPESRF